MKRQTMGKLAAAAAMSAAVATAAAVPATAGSCGGTPTAVFGDGAIALRAPGSGIAADERAAGVIRASFTPPPAGGDVHRPESAKSDPAPGRWTTLLAGLLGVVTIARRRMS